jgi:threonine/homoserine/homoserine lactone efflux protein
MESLLAFLSIGAALSVGAMSPGPSFVMVARTSLAGTRADGVAAALGMGVGGVIFATAALLGLQAVLAAVPMLYAALKVGGGAYLMFLAYRIWCGARDPLQLDTVTSVRRPFTLGLLTQLTNPKTAVVYASVFASLLPRQAPLVLLVALPVLVFAIEFGWYGVVAATLARPLPRAHYLASKLWLDRIAAGVMGALGAKLVLEAVVRAPSPN